MRKSQNCRHVISRFSSDYSFSFLGSDLQTTKQKNKIADQFQNKILCSERNQQYI